MARGNMKTTYYAPVYGKDDVCYVKISKKDADRLVVHYKFVKEEPIRLPKETLVYLERE